MTQMFIKFKWYYFLSFLLSIGFISCSEEIIRENFLAIVEENAITVEEFRQFYKFDPNFGIDSTGMDALKDQLDKYIDQFLAGMRANDEGLWDESYFVHAYNWELRQAMLRQLKREEVEDSIDVTDEEILQEFMDLSVEVNIRHLFTESEIKSDELYRQLIKGVKFEYLASQIYMDTVLSRNGGNLGWLKLIDFDDNLTKAIQKLKIGQLSQPVSSNWGYHIIDVLNRKAKASIVEEEYIHTKDKLYQRIKSRKIRKLSNAFVSNYLSQFNPQLNKLPFRQLLHVLLPPSEREKKEYMTKIILSDGLIDAAESDLSEHVDQELIKYKDGTVSIRKFLHALKEIPLKHRPRFSNAQQFANQIGVWQRDNLLLERAIELELDENDQVLEEINLFIAKESYLHYLNAILENSKIPFFEYNYFSISEELRFQNPGHPLAGFFNLEEWRRWRAQQDLHNMLRVNNPSIWINTKLLEREIDHIDWNHQIRMFNKN